MKIHVWWNRPNQGVQPSDLEYEHGIKLHKKIKKKEDKSEHNNKVQN